MSVRMSCSAVGKLRERRAGELKTQSQPLASAAKAPGVCGLQGMESQAWRAAPSLCPEVRARVMQGSVVQTHCGDFLRADQRDLTNRNPTASACLLAETGVFRFRPHCSVLILTSLSSSLTLLTPASFQITGVILLAVGVWGKLTLGTYISLIAENSTNAPYVLIGTGTTIVVFGLFGCFATCRGSPWMLKLYAMFLSLVFLAELVAGISGFVFRHEIKDTFLRTYTDAMQNYNGNDERSRAVDHVQRSLSCCGVQNYTNWSTSPYFLEHGIPPSCCMNDTDCNPQDLHNLTVAATKVNQKGCYDLVTSFMETNMGIIAGVAFGIAFSQFCHQGNIG
eukprot:bmy_14583T0